MGSGVLVWLRSLLLLASRLVGGGVPVGLVIELLRVLCLVGVGLLMGAVFLVWCGVQGKLVGVLLVCSRFLGMGLLWGSGVPE